MHLAFINISKEEKKKEQNHKNLCSPKKNRLFSEYLHTFSY